MSFRLRLTLAVAALVALAIAVASTFGYLVTSDQLNDEIDQFLRQQADVVVRGRFSPQAADDVPVVLGLRGSDTIVQALLRNGEIRPLFDDEVLLPVDDEDHRIAASAAAARLRTVEVDSTRIRVITAPGLQVGGRRNVGAIMIGRELTEVDNVLGGLRRRLIVLGVGGTAAAGLVGWLLASGMSRPVRRLTRAAEHVARTQELGAHIDIDGRDEVARLAESFNTMLEALDRSRQQQRRLVMDASHELRTPLTSLRTNVDLLRRVPDLGDGDRQEIVADLDREVSELSDLVTELVDLATTSQRDDEPWLEVDLGRVVSEVVDRARRRTGRTIQLDVSRSGTVMGQPSLLDRAVWNLVDNACKFSPPEGVVDVLVHRGDVAVRDQGPGIAEADRAHVFDRFYRSTTTRSAPGSGLGLAIVAEIVAAHGGSTFVDDAPGGGAAVGFSLPVV